MAISFLQDRESDSRDWEPDALELPLVEPWPHPRPERPAIEPAVIIDAPDGRPEQARVIVIDLA